MIIDFHVHVLPPEDMAAFTGTQFHKNIGARHKPSPTTIENALEAAKIGSVDITVISNPIHNLRDMDPQQQLERCQLIKQEPLHYLKMMYLESTCYHPPGARFAIDPA